MAAKTFKITLTLDEADAAYFQRLYRVAKRNARAEDAPKTIRQVKKLIVTVRSAKKVPAFVETAITTLEDLIQMIEDEDYALPRTVSESAVAALTYFANPQDVIPDDIPAFGFLDDALIISFVGDEFKHELWAYRRFRTFRGGAEQRPWTNVAKDRLPKRLEAYRKELREKVAEKKQADKAKASKAGVRRFSW
ncbi:MAG: YkvA family protein [Myxococcales bacterium]|nr:YkvA family protein [Myxococcales bacterium]